MEGMCLQVSYCIRTKYEEIFFFFGILKKSLKEGVGPDPLVKGTVPRIRSRTKMSRIPNTTLHSPFHGPVTC
jgi:hypothetical protein